MHPRIVDKAAHYGFGNPEETSPGVQNRGISGPTIFLKSNAATGFLTLKVKSKNWLSQTATII